MKEKELPKTNSSQGPINFDWKFCPICGNQLPSIQNLKFCIVCGTDIKFIKDHKKLRPTYTSNPPKSPMQYSQYKTPSIPSIYYGPEKITDENLIDNKEHELWGTMTSIGLPLAALLIMDGLVVGLLTLIIFTSFDLNFLTDLVSNIYLISLISLFELVFLIIPLLYVRKYLQNPTIKNGLILLGFTIKGFDKKRIFKEVLIGLIFAVIGVSVVILISIGLELLLKFVFGINIIQDSSSLIGEIGPLDLPGVIVFSVVVILVIGTSEEILFRGFMQKGLVRSLGSSWGIIVTALIFALIHLLGIFVIALESLSVFIISFFLQFTPYFAISLMLGWLYHWRNENLTAVMITHGFYDVLIIVVTYLIYGVL